jgi:Flp pilus assembly protein TadB
MAIELEKAMRAAAARRMRAGTAVYDPVAAGLRVHEPPPLPLLLVALIILCLVVLIAGIVWELAQVPPAHILIVAFVIGLGVLRFRRRRR